jgi:hypothetical protein
MFRCLDDGVNSLILIVHENNTSNDNFHPPSSTTTSRQTVHCIWNHLWRQTVDRSTSTVSGQLSSSIPEPTGRCEVISGSIWKNMDESAELLQRCGLTARGWGDADR